MQKKDEVYRREQARQILALHGINQRAILTPFGGMDAFCEAEGLEIIVENRYGHGGRDKCAATDGDRIMVIRQPCCFGGAWGEDSGRDRLLIEEIDPRQLRREFPYPIHETAHHDKCPISGIRNVQVVERTFYVDQRGRNQVMYEAW